MAKKLAAHTRRLKRAARAAVLWPERARTPPAVARKRTKVAPSPRKRLRAKLDALWGLFIKKRDCLRTGGICAICGIKPIDSAYHIQPRGDDSTRWDIENGVGSCHGCNYWEMKNRGRRVRDRHISIFGLEKIERLEAKARILANFELLDLERIYADLKRRIEKGEWD